MKHKILLGAIVLICLSLLASSSVAYTVKEGTAHSVITSGGVDIALVEQQLDANGTLVPYPDGAMIVMPNTTVSKVVTVKNTGGSEAWVRVKVTPSITGPDGKELSVLAGNKAAMGFDLGEDWDQGSDGWYYYQEKLPAKGSTTALFEEVNFAPEMGNEYQGCTAQLILSAQAVQTAHNGETVADAQGWPTNP